MGTIVQIWTIMFCLEVLGGSLRSDFTGACH
jgi:hypothetical protein